MKKSIIKFTIIGMVVTIAYLGVSFSQEKINISGEQASVTVVTLGTQAQAYCNEAPDGSFNNGLCTGLANDPSTRCLQPVNPLASTTCTRDNGY